MKAANQRWAMKQENYKSSCQWRQTKVCASRVELPLNIIQPVMQLVKALLTCVTMFVVRL